MPAASTKTENKISQESADPMKQVLVVVDKKVRNLEKRKGKLDGYIEKENGGTALEKDQKAAVEKYGEVVQNLEFARELQKQFTAISADAEKILKKQAKREKAAQQNLELKRIKEMLQLQNLLDNLGSDKVRNDFQTGKHGAVVLTEENLNQLDELYKLISPTRDGETDYQEQLNAAGEHILNLIDAKEKEVVGTTYKEIKELIDLINHCGYFENARGQEEEEETAAAVEEDFGVTNSQEPIEVQAPQETYEKHQQQIEQFSSTVTSHETNQPDMSSVAANADSYFSKSAQQQQQQHEEIEDEDDPAYSRHRPFQEIVSSVQGNFNFLQESTIDMESPHMDPAVVAAHPMPAAPLGCSTTHSADTLSQQAFSSQGFGDLQQNQQSLGDQSQNDTQSLLKHQQQKQQTVSALSGQDYSSQTFTQNSLSQSLQSDSLFQNSVKDNTQSMSSNVMGQTVSDTTISQFELPPSLPMPPGHDSLQENQSVDSQPEKKQFTMNPNAGVFQSQIYSQSSVDHSQQQQNDFGGHSDYQNDNYQSGFSRRGGGFRGNRGRGGSSDRGNTNNGYGGNRGSNRGNYNDRRGGYQGYPPRNDYRPEGGYQGQNYNGNNYSGGFQKRGGSMRGSNPRGNSGGAMRGGPPRGSSRGRGGSGGFGRPNMNQQQQVA